MASGFTGGGAPEFFTGRSIATATATTTMSNQPPQIPYRSQLPGIFLDPATQIARQTQPSYIGKRSHSDFQTQQFHNNNQGFNNFFLRPAKRVNYQITSPISPLSPIDISQDTSSLLSSSQQRFSLPVVQQLRPQTPHQNSSFRNNNNSSMALQGVQYANMRPVQNRVSSSMTTQEFSEQKVISHHRLQELENHRLQELEKQLLDDDDDVNGDDNDAVSVITNANSEWSETIQNLMSPTQKPISPSPTSSSSSSSSVASPGSACSKQSLMEAATNIYEGKSDAAAAILTRLAQQSNPKGGSEERLMSYMVSTLKSRANPTENPPPVFELFDKEHAESTQLLYKMSPCFKLGFMAANLAIVEAALEEKSDNDNKIHVIDFDIGQGGDQYLHLLHALKTRGGGKPAIVKITSVALSADNGGEEERVRKLLSQEAEKLGVSFTFNAVASHRLDELTRESLGCEPDEPLAVNFAFKLHRMADESVSTDNPRDELLRRVKGLAPRVVTLVEQEMNTNTAPFMARVGETCAYYGALLESMEATISRELCWSRVKVEEGLSRKLANSVACEGRDRLERCEVFGKWRARMGMAGFELKPLSQNVTELLKSSMAQLGGPKRVNSGFAVKEENGGVGFGWMGRTLTVASAWR